MVASSLGQRSFPACLIVVGLAPAVSACLQNESGLVEAGEVGDMSAGEPPHERFDAALVAACGEGGTTARGDDRLLRAPYLQRVDAYSAAVLWTSDGAAPASVRVTNPADHSVITEVNAHIDTSAPLPAGAQYIAELEDLSPETIYCYEISAAGAAWTLPTGFRTAPLAGSVVRFAAMGDVGEAGADQYAVLEHLLDVPFQTVVISGDVGYPDGRLQDYESHFFDVYAYPLARAPFFPASGNHDYSTAGAKPFFSSFALPENAGPSAAEHWYSFDWGDVHVAVLDTEKAGPAQSSWLERDLAESKAIWKVVLGHRPPYSSGEHGSDLGIRNTFAPIFERNHVDLALFGHDHDYERTHPMNGVTYVITGGGGEGTRSVGTSDFTAFSIQVQHFVLVEADSEHLTLWAIDATGKTFDTLQLDAARR